MSKNAMPLETLSGGTGTNRVATSTVSAILARCKPGQEPMMSLPDGTAGGWYRAWLRSVDANGRPIRQWANPEYDADAAARNLLTLMGGAA